MPRLVLLVLAALLLLAAGSAAAQEPTPAERRLAERHAPILAFKQNPDPPCSTDGEQYLPSSVGLMLARPDVTLRGPGADGPVITRAPTPADVFGRGPEYHLDVPGNPRRPGCGYARAARAADQGVPPVAYAHVATQADRPGHIALQYYFFYYFNQFNDLHEGDWEGIQLLFRADSATEALQQDPVGVAYAQHTGAERADWDDPKLERDGDRPVVYAAAGSHASYFGQDLWLGRSAKEGFGCDDTRGPSRRLDLRAVTLPDAVDDPSDRYAWLMFEGRWGDPGSGFSRAPTGPRTKDRWQRPVDFHEDARESSVAVPADGVVASSVTGFFCRAVAAGSRVYDDAVTHPLAALGVLAVLGLLVAGAGARTRWTPVGSARLLGPPRALGQVARAATDAYRDHVRVLAPLGAVYLVGGALAVAAQGLVTAYTPLGTLFAVDGAAGSLTLLAVLGLGGVVHALTGVFLAAAVAEALRRHDDGESVRLPAVARAVAARARVLASAGVQAILVVTFLALTVVGLPWAIRQAVRWAFAGPAVMLAEPRSGAAALDASARSVRGRWWRAAILVVTLSLAVAFIAMSVGLALLLLTDRSLAFVNLAAAIVHGLAMPVVAVALAMFYADQRAGGPHPKAPPAQGEWRRRVRRLARRRGPED